jgi:hypothetical protein
MKKIIFFIFSIGIISGCKEIYNPEINNLNTALVIQGMITNNPGEAYVRLYKAVPFDSTDNRMAVGGASVTVIDDQGQSFEFINAGYGYYENKLAFGKKGHSYTLTVSTPDGNTYVSKAQIMPDSYKQDSIYAAASTKDILIEGSMGDFLKTTQIGVETWVDLSSNGNEIPKCRFEQTITVLYTYYGKGFPPPTVFCWKTFDPSKNLNITENKFDKNKAIIEGHSINFFCTDLSLYDERKDLSLSGWLLTLHKFNLNQETYQYYDAVNKQLTASGKIFDPVPSQLAGNLICTNNSKNLVFGFFEVSSSETYYYRYYFFRGVHLIQKSSFPEFTPVGEVVNHYPEFFFN